MHDNIDFSNMNTVEDIVNILSKLSFNADNFEKVYYSLYLEETPMDITFRQYNSDGVINELTIPNVAKMKTTAYTSTGNPNGQVSAPKGSFCVDITTSSPYYKKEGSDNYGWISLCSTVTLGSQGTSAANLYITPNGDASELAGLNMDNIKASSNPLTINRGGTGRRGATGFAGILKGNGTNSYNIAVDSVDYLGSESMRGIITYFPVLFGTNGKPKIPNGWLICDGSEYSGASGSVYEGLYKIIGIAYGGDEDTKVFKVPNLIDKYIRCLNSTDSASARSATDVQTSQNKVHTHSAGYSISTENASHTHTASCSSAGDHYHGAMAEKTDQGSGDFGYYDSGNWHWGSYGDIDRDNTLWRTSTNGAHSHTVTVSSQSMSHTHSLSGTMESVGGTEFEVTNMIVVPMIKF